MKKSSSKKNFLYNMVYQITLMILPLITMPYVSRILGADGIGTYSYTYSVAQYFLLFGMLGIENYGNRSIARVRDNIEMRNKVFSSIYALQLIIATLSVVAYIIYVVMLREGRMFAFLQLFYVLSGMFDINWLFFGMEDFKITVTRKVLIKVANVVCIFLFVHTRNDLWKYILLLSLGYFIAQSSMWFFAKRYIKFTIPPLVEIVPHFKEVVILFVPMVATSIYRMMDKVMIGGFSSMQQVGYYENSEKLINVCLCVIGAFGAVMMPRMSNLYSKNKKEECEDLLIRTMEVAIFIGCAISFGIASVANDFIPIFYGKGYEECIIITKMLSITVPFIAWACIVRTMYLIPNEKNRVYIYSVLFGAAINLAVNLILIPMYAAKGAAVGTIIAEIMVAVYQTIRIRTDLNIMKCLKKSMPFVCFGLIMLILLKCLPYNVSGSIVLLISKICIGGGIYLCISFAYFIKTKNKNVYNILGKIKGRM